MQMAVCLRCESGRSLLRCNYFKRLVSRPWVMASFKGEFWSWCKGSLLVFQCYRVNARSCPPPEMVLLLGDTNLHCSSRRKNHNGQLGSCMPWWPITLQPWHHWIWDPFKIRSLILFFFVLNLEPLPRLLQNNRFVLHIHTNNVLKHVYFMLQTQPQVLW